MQDLRCSLHSNMCSCVLQQYVHSTKELYHSELERVDFLNATEKCRETINSWVERQTNGKHTCLLYVLKNQINVFGEHIHH